MLSEFLSSCGFLVHTAIDGLDAIAVARRVLPSLILMDLMMPRLDGLEATRRLKADTRTSAIPIIALTASAPAHGREVALTAGCDDLLLKPCDLEVLADQLHKRLAPCGHARVVARDLSLQEAIAADIALDNATAAAIERSYANGR